MMKVVTKYTTKRRGNTLPSRLVSRLLSVVAAIVIVGSFGMSVGAQSSELPAGNGFRISPVREETRVERGKSLTFTINVENPSSVDVTAKPVVNNFLAGEDETGRPRLVLDDSVLPPANDIKRLIQPLSDFEVPSGKSVDVQVTIAVPDDARPGGYYGAVRFIPVLPGLKDDNVALTASVGTLVLLEVPGDLRHQLDLVQLSAAQKTDKGETLKGFFIGGNVSIATRLRNTGDIHVQPFGKIQVHNLWGKLIHEYEFNNVDPRSNILPDSTRKFIDDIPQQRWFGRYTITANLGFSQGGGDLINARATFWYFSPIAFYALLIGLFIVSAGGYTLYRRYKKKHRKHKHSY